jgi:hypothetical protein
VAGWGLRVVEVVGVARGGSLLLALEFGVVVGFDGFVLLLLLLLLLLMLIL